MSASKGNRDVAKLIVNSLVWVLQDWAADLDFGYYPDLDSPPVEVPVLDLAPGLPAPGLVGTERVLEGIKHPWCHNPLPPTAGPNSSAILNALTLFASPLHFHFMHRGTV
uniref:Uncharacterized protein n=1 Tax=mine drainage metagenome TaxID=410659 RepID=E6QSE1_9ZZZZ